MKADAPSVVVTLQQFFLFYVTNLDCTGLIYISSFSKLDKYIPFKAGFAWKVISIRFRVVHTEFVTQSK